jgi:hypothetical protein
MNRDGRGLARRPLTRYWVSAKFVKIIKDVLQRQDILLESL